MKTVYYMAYEMQFTATHNGAAGNYRRTWFQDTNGAPMSKQLIIACSEQADAAAIEMLKEKYPALRVEELSGSITFILSVVDTEE